MSIYTLVALCVWSITDLYVFFIHNANELRLSYQVLIIWKDILELVVWRKRRGADLNWNSQIAKTKKGEKYIVNLI